MTDTVFRRISFIRPGATRNGNTVVPTGIRITYNLNMPLTTAIEHMPNTEPRCDDDLSDMAENLLKNGATYVDATDNFMPGYVVEDAATGKGAYWIFFKDNAKAFVAHRMTTAKDGDVLFGRNAHDNMALNAIELDVMAAIMDGTQNGKQSCRRDTRPDAPEFG